MRFILKKNIEYKTLSFQEGNIGTILKKGKDSSEVLLYERGIPIEMVLNNKILELVQE